MKISRYFLCIAVLFLSVVSRIVNADVSSQPSANQDAWTYTVNANDSFERIYQKYLNKRSNIRALSKYNHLQLNKKLHPGQVIYIPVGMLKKIPTNAQILLVYGDVNVTSVSDGDSHKVKKGDLLSQGDSLVTGKNSLAKLVFADGSNIDIQPNSNLSIQACYKYAGKETFVTNLKLVKGRTEVSANPAHAMGNTLQIQTPSAVAAVRGTQFRVGTESNIALQETIEGQVAFSASGQEVLLNKGYGSVAEQDKAPLPPIQLPSAPNVDLLPKLFETQTAEFDMPAQEGVVAWVGQLALDADFTQILAEKTSQSNQLVFADLIDGRYYLKLRAQDEHGLQSTDALHSFSIKVRAPEPVFELIEPLDGAVIPLAPTVLSWTQIPNASRYIVQIARDVNFADKIFEQQVTSSQLVTNQSFGRGEYYWRVEMLSDAEPPKFSSVRKFSR